MSTILVSKGRQVVLHFSLAMEDGSLVDSTFERQPATLVIGDGNLPEGFERHLIGMSAGSKGEWHIPPERAFGQLNPNNVQHFPRSQFSKDMDLQPGLVISFADAAKTELPGVVKAVSDSEVVVDFNHPLAGHTLVFTAQILSVE